MGQNKPSLHDEFGKVAVLMGGWAAEREVSLNSGKAVLAGLLEKGVNAYPVDASRDVLDVLRAEKFDLVFNFARKRWGRWGVTRSLGYPPDSLHRMWSDGIGYQHG